MGKIRVKDLAKKMGIPGQDLVFKLKSIGARIESEETLLDTDVIQAILLGKRLTQPREVILRDTEERPVTPGSDAYEDPGQNTPAGFRPQRRTMIQRVENRIRNIDAERPRPGMPQVPAERSADAPDAPIAEAEVAYEEPAAGSSEVAEAEVTASPEAKAAGPAPKPASRERPAPARPVRSKARARLIAHPDDAQKALGPTSNAPPPPRRPPASRAPVRTPLPGRGAPPSGRPGGQHMGRPGGGGGHPGPGGRPMRPGRPTPPPASIRDGRRLRRPRRPERGPVQDLRSYQRALRPNAPPEDVVDVKPSSERGIRRAARKQETGPRTHSAEIPAFKEARPDGPVILTEGMTVREFAESLGVKSKDLIRALVMRGIMANINHILDPETAKSLAADLGVEVMEVSFEEEVQLQHDTESTDDADKTPRAPVVTVMGHVDHGKTTLLDAIRQANVAAGEAGGITQHIGAYHVDVNDQKIVFLDTPGHEAFTLMRARGAKVTDIVILVVAADDGVMPQTIEAINHAQAAEVPIIVAINKIDKANANLDRVRKELSDHGLVVEDWGGDVVSVGVSALKREGVKELLEMVLLNAELLELKASADVPAQGTVLEARKDIGRGIVATVLIQDGTLRDGDAFVAGSAWGRVRTMVDDLGARIDEVGPATPVEVTGFYDLPGAGDTFQGVEDEAKARSITDFRKREDRQRELAPKADRMSLAALFDRIESGEAKELAVVVKADVHGSVEVLRDTLEKLSTDKVKVKVIHAAVGAITTNDVILASASDAVIIGFNIRPERKAVTLAEKEEVDIRLHTVIYELSDELKKAMAGMLEPVYEERQKGAAEVRDTFKVPKIGTIAGCYVTEGTIPRNASVRLLRDSRVVFEGRLASLKRFKDDASEVRSGFECGIGLDGFQDVKPGDIIEAYVREAVAPTL